jgi:hypothetical protein
LPRLAQDALDLGGRCGRLRAEQVVDPLAKDVAECNERLSTPSCIASSFLAVL